MDALSTALTAVPVLHVLALLTLLLPAAGALLLILLSVSGVQPHERWIAIVSGVTMSAAAIAAFFLATFTMLRPGREFDEVLWTMYEVGSYRLDIAVYVDPLSAKLTALGAVVIPVLCRYSARYLHNEPGYLRYFVLLGVAATGFFWFVLGGSVDVAFFGWELLGLSSALLVAFYWERPHTVTASGRVFATYRVADIALLGGVVLLHHYARSSGWATVLGVVNPEHGLHLGLFPATVLGLAFLLAAIGKSALFPATGYVVRAMEGPTPSSALFYGTLSIHAGVYLLLRVEPLVSHAPVVRAAVITVGCLTAITASLGARVRADAKGSLALASAAQTGLMVAEIGMGWTAFAQWHLLAHGLLRLAQFLRSPSWLQDAAERRSALGGGRYRSGFHVERLLPEGLRDGLYAAALSRFGLDALIDRLVARPLEALAHRVSRNRPRLRPTSDGPRIHAGPLCRHPAIRTTESIAPDRKEGGA